MQVLIIGKNSNLSEVLKEKIENSHVLSSREIQKNINLLDSYRSQEVAIIFNNFYSSTLFNKINNNVEYVTSSITVTAMILDYFKGCKIKKIIYTSSSSVYGNNIYCDENDDLIPLNLHAALKVANEKMLELHCKKYKIDFTIARVFNMYGENDNFSIVSKILNAVEAKKEIMIVNHGNAIRDFIHVNDVADIYVRLLNKQVKVLNIGTGKGTAINVLLELIRSRGIDLQIKNITKDELKVSTANSKLLFKVMGKINFISIEDFIYKRLKLE